MTPDPIPKFTSFKPKAKPKDSDPKTESRSTTKHEHTSSRGDNVERDRAAHEHSRSKRRTNPSSGHAPETKHAREYSQQVAKSTWAYAVDIDGDANNLRYGSLHKYDISQYHRRGHGNVLGIRNQLKIDRDQTTLTQVVLGSSSAFNDDKPRSLSRAKDITRLPSKVLRIESDPSTFTSEDPFIPLSRSSKRKRDSESPSAVPEYRDLGVDRRRPAGEHNILSDSDFSEDDSTSDPGTDIRRRNGELSRLTRDDPTNVCAWEELIELQRGLVAPGTETHLLTTTQRRAVAELRLGLYRKALASASGPARRKLLRSMLDEGSAIWDESERRKYYEETILNDPSNVALWRQYIEIIQNHKGSPSWEDLKARFLICLSRLNAARRSPRDAESGKDLELAHVYVILRFTKVMHDMGYEEQSIAVWQALVHIHVMGSGQQSDADARYKALDEAWDNEEPRFGDSAPIETEAGLGPAASIAWKEGHKQDLSPFTAWAEKEQSLSLSSEIPGKTSEASDQVAADDVLHVVFFDDLKEVLETTTTAIDQDALIDAFLAFFGLPVVPASTCKIRPWRDDPALFPQPIKKADDAHHAGSTQSFAVTLDSIWNGLLFPVDIKLRHRIPAFINQGLQQLVKAAPPSSYLSVYWLAFQACCFPEMAPKTAKRLIKSQFSNLALYNAAARIETHLGRPEKARLIYGAAIQMSGGLGKGDNIEEMSRRRDLLRLAHAWAWTEMHLGDEKQALSHLFSLRQSPSTTAEERIISTATRLSLDEDVKSGLTTSLYHNDPDSAALYASAHLLLTYLTSPTALSATLVTHKSHLALLETLKATPPLSEAVHQSLVSIVTHHLDHHRPHRPADLLAILDISLALHPTNTLLLALHDRLTGPQSAIDAALRSSIALGPHSGIAKWLAALEKQIARSKVVGPEATRSLFRRATAQGSGVEHAPTVWWLWLRFEAGRSLGAAKRVWASGRAGMGWSKAWVLEGMRMFDCPGGLSRRELRGVYDSMLDVGMRMRVEMEEEKG